MSDTDKLRKIRRYQIENGNDIAVVIERGDDSSESLSAELVNINVGGAKFKVSEPIILQETLAIRVNANQLTHSFVVSGAVCWVTPGPKDVWWIGCSFTPQLPDEVLAEFAAAGIFERRDHNRERTELRVTAQRELKGDSHAVMLQNISRGGLCLISKTASPPGDRILIRFDVDERTIEVPCQTRWQVNSGERYLIGCEFMNSRDFTTLSRIARSMELKDEALCGRLAVSTDDPTVDAGGDETSRRAPHRSPIVLIGAIVLACLLARELITSRWPESTDSVIANPADSNSPPKPEAPDATFAAEDSSMPVSKVDSTPLVKSEIDSSQTPSGHSKTHPVSKSHFRTWYDKTGRFSVVARVIDVNENVVRLQTKTGRRVSVPVERLSSDDVRYIHDSVKLP